MKWIFEVEVYLDTNEGGLAIDWFDNKFTGSKSIHFSQNEIDRLVDIVEYSDLSCHPETEVSS
jgi:hypothetical protein